MHKLSIDCCEPLWIELVGPAGSGKSTIIRRVVEEIGGAEVSCDYLGVLNKTGFFIETTGDILSTLGWRTWRKFGWRKRWSRYKRVSGGLLHMRQLSSGVALVDEGPIRTLADKAIYGDAMKIYWENYCSKTIDAIIHSCTSRILIVKISVDEKTRFERRKIRNTSKEASLEGFKTWGDWQRRANKKQSHGTMRDSVMEELGRRMGTRFIYHEVDGARDLSVVSSEVVSLIRKHCGREEAAGKAADG